MLHLADIHWDPEYLEGSNTDCGDPICCRASSGAVVNATDAAGYWGDRRGCDLPWRTIENAVAHMAEMHAVKLVVDYKLTNIMRTRINKGYKLHYMDWRSNTSRRLVYRKGRESNDHR